VDFADSPLRRCHVGGELIGKTVALSPSARLEVLQRRTTGSFTWQFRQAVAALLWFKNGFHAAHLRVDGHDVETKISPLANLGLVAAQSQIDGEFETAEICDYTLIFLDTSKLPASLQPQQSMMTFGDPRVVTSLEELTRFPDPDPDLFSLMLEGWFLQTIARLMTGTSAPQTSGWLPAASIDRVQKYVEIHYAEPLSVAHLASIAGFSERHFTRGFRAATTRTPMQFVMEVRIRNAKRLIREGLHSIAETAHLCGFGQAQHFSVAFKKATGVAPRDYMRSVSGDL
jgi:AraC family transcriptional regulator